MEVSSPPVNTWFLSPPSEGLGIKTKGMGVKIWMSKESYSEIKSLIFNNIIIVLSN
jgi:hypothetical protein